MGPSHKIPEEKMFLAIFNYIEHLYGKIKPKKLFFMAVDGVSKLRLSNPQVSHHAQK
jgi:5'-3' exoribonuclease 1